MALKSMFHTMESTEPLATHRSLERGLRVIEVTAASGGSASLAEIARATALPRSTAHHLVRALVELGYLAQQRSAGPYLLGPRLFRLVEPPFTADQLADLARDSLETLGRRTGHGSSLGVLRDGVVTIVAKREGEGPVRVVQEVGAQRPVHCSAVGKVLVAWLPPRELEALLRSVQFERRTSHTITSAAAFRRELGRVRSRGVALDNEEHFEGIRCLAAPVRDHRGAVRAALCVIGPSHQFQRRHVPRIREDALAVAAALSQRLGHPP